MKLKLFILACMLIIHVGADEMDVEYGDDYDDENEPAVFNGK